MEQIISVSDTLEEKGRRIYQTNDNYRRLANMMEHPEFREFFQLYMQDWESAKTIIMFMKMYEALEKHSKIELSPYQKLSIVKDVIEDGELRRRVCEGILEWTKIKVVAGKSFLTLGEKESIERGPS
jgi:hypothetical protein